MLALRLVSCAALASAAAAQWSQVCPAHYATWEGSSLSGLPFSGTAFPVRLQQAHVEPKGATRAITQLAFRSSAVAGDARFQPRTVDVDIQMGHGNLATFSNVFAANYTTPAVAVFARRMVNTPDYSIGSRNAPTSFDFVFALDVPFTHNGVDDLIWDINVYGASGAGASVPLDVAQSGSNLVIPSNYQLNGTGCTYGGREMVLRPTGSLQGFPVSGWIQDWSSTNCPPNSPTVFMLGVTDPNLPVRGLCTNLRVLPLVQVPGVSDAAGAFDPFPNTSPLPRIPYAASSVGARLEAQVAAIDATGPTLYASNGATTILPPWTPTVGIARLYQSPTSGGPALSTVLGLVVRVSGP